MEQRIKAAASIITGSWWDLAELLYEFHEERRWADLDYDTLNEFLAQPDLGISRALFFQMTRLWRDLAVTRQVDRAVLRELEPSKVREVVPAIMRGDVSIEEALADARDLGHRDMRKRYRGDPNAKLDAGAEPVRIQCGQCGAWRTEQEIAEWAEENS
jgi:hypothetical protein